MGERRDAATFLQPGDQPRPAGEFYLSWRLAVDRPVSVEALHRVPSEVEPEAIATWLDTGQGAPVSLTAAVLQAVLADAPRMDVSALVQADTAFGSGAWLRDWNVGLRICKQLRRSSVQRGAGSC